MLAKSATRPVVVEVDVEAVEAQADDRLRRSRDSSHLVLRVDRRHRRDAVIVGVGRALAELDGSEIVGRSPAPCTEVDVGPSEVKNPVLRKLSVT